MDKPGSARSRRGWLSLYLKGMAMGVAEVVPGVSGGTIAFVSGIYDELVRTLASLRPSSLGVLREGLSQFWKTHNLTFLLVLGLGMVSGVALFAKALTLALELARPVVWGFFFGVIVCSVVTLGVERERRTLLLLFPVGLLAGIALVSLDPLPDSGLGAWAYFLGGAVAVSAWLLPAVSGSFLLLVFGLYENVLGAVTALDLTVLVPLAAGIVLGLLAFANVLAWLMRRHREPTLSLLTGFLSGSLVELWPWAVDGARLQLPTAYATSTGADPLLPWVLLAAAAGTVLLLGLRRLE